MVDQEYLTSLLVEQFGYTRKQSKQIYKLIFGTIADKVKNGEQVKLPHLGKLYRAELKAYTARNPKTGEQVDVPNRFRIKLSGKPFIL